jgi:hypothetical protein
MSENPYRLARDIRGIGFKTADAIATKLGIEKTAMVRVRAGISYALTEAMDDGHCGLPAGELLPLAESLLEVPVELVQAAVELELADGTIVVVFEADAVCASTDSCGAAAAECRLSRRRVADWQQYPQPPRLTMQRQGPRTPATPEMSRWGSPQT